MSSSRTTLITEAIGAGWQRQEELWQELTKDYTFNAGAIPLGTDAGWWLPLLEAFDQIETAMTSAPGYRFKVMQIKEKFGGLRFYCHAWKDGVEDEDDDVAPAAEDLVLGDLRMLISAAVDKAEAECSKRCEVCGVPGSPRHGGWIKTLCDRHDAERKAEQKKRGY